MRHGLRDSRPLRSALPVRAQVTRTMQRESGQARPDRQVSLFQLDVARPTGGSLPLTSDRSLPVTQGERDTAMVPSSARRVHLALLAALLVVLMSAVPSHADYVKCAVQQANKVLVNPSCKGAVKKCAAHSTCGKPTAVTCCLTTTKGTTCKIKKDAAHCTAKQGTVGTCTSCCDACPAPGSGPSCPAPTTTTTTTTSTTTTTTTQPCFPTGVPCSVNGDCCS